MSFSAIFAYIVYKMRKLKVYIKIMNRENCSLKYTNKNVECIKYITKLSLKK